MSAFAEMMMKTILIMIKEIKTNQLRLGMFVHDFNCSWLQHPFFSSSIKVRDEKMVQRVLDSGIREVYIDTDKGLDVVLASKREETECAAEREINKNTESNEGDRNPVIRKD